jgi:carbamoyltransferase
MHEEPIICSPDDAVRAFLDGNLDFLAAGDFIVPHPCLKNNMLTRREQVAISRTYSNTGPHSTI